MSVRMKRGAVAALMAAHCAGMVDMVALPVWIGALMSHKGFDPQQAGLLVSLFLAGAVVASVWMARRMQRARAAIVASLGYGLACAMFGILSLFQTLAPMAVCHALAGLATGAALSATHGTIARSERPHRLYAVVGIALGVFAIVFLGVTSNLVASWGTEALFAVLAAVMGLAALACWLAFPGGPPEAGERGASIAKPLAPAVWFGVIGICAMGLVQSMTFSFLERVGQHRGFGVDAVTGVLIALAVVNLTPSALAAWLEHRLDPRQVIRTGPVLQALIAFTLMTATAFLPWAGAASVFAAVMIFTHTFAFGLLAEFDRTGRVLAATPAMLMTGAALGPVLGGTLVKFHGFEALGLAALGFDLVALACMHLAGRMPARPAVAG